MGWARDLLRSLIMAFTGNIFSSGVYGGVYHQRMTFASGQLSAEAGGRNWAVDDLQSYTPGAITTFSGGTGFSAAPSVSWGAAAIVTYTEPRTGLTKNCLELPGTGGEVVFPLVPWSPFHRVSISMLCSMEDSGAAQSVEMWAGWCKDADGGPSNASTLQFYGSKWANGTGGIGTFEPLGRIVDGVDGTAYYTANQYGIRRQNGVGDVLMGVAGGSAISTHSGPVALKRCLWSIMMHRGPTTWNGNGRSHAAAGGHPTFVIDGEPAHSLRLARFTWPTPTGPAWMGGNQFGAGGFFSGSSNYSNGEMDHAVIHYRESTGTKKLRIYALAFYMSGTDPQP